MFEREGGRERDKVCIFLHFSQLFIFLLGKLDLQVEQRNKTTSERTILLLTQMNKLQLKSEDIE